MTSTIAADSGLELEEKPEPTEEQKKMLLEHAIEKREKLAESCLDMAKMFIQNGKSEIAQRRLKQLVEEFAGSAAASEARVILRTL